MPLPIRRTARLRWGRVSTPGASYFLTLCTKSRTPVLTELLTATRIVDTWRRLHSDGDVELLAATVMPDHVHALFTLGARLAFGSVMAKLKNLARDNGRAPWHWQEDGFEHQLRAAESAEDYAFYIFMNGYRAQLLPITQAWPWWQCPDPQRFAFLDKLMPNGSPQPEWLGDVQGVAKRIVTGE